MGEDNEREAGFPALKLPFLHIPSPTVDSPEHPSRPSTPPLQTSASVPFKWEEEPGKPRPCTDIIPLEEPAKSLELPPCLSRVLFMDPGDKITKTPSPTTVLDGPYNVGRPRFSSFRFFRDGHGSFDNFSSGSPEGTALDLLLGRRVKAGGLLGKFRGGKKEVDGGSCRFSPSSFNSYDSDGRCKNGGGVKMRRNGSFSSVPHVRSSHLWTSICQGIKQVIQWKSNRKTNKGGRERRSST